MKRPAADGEQFDGGNRVLVRGQILKRHQSGPAAYPAEEPAVDPGDAPAGTSGVEHEEDPTDLQITGDTHPATDKEPPGQEQPVQPGPSMAPAHHQPSNTAPSPQVMSGRVCESVTWRLLVARAKRFVNALVHAEAGGSDQVAKNKMELQKLLEELHSRVSGLGLDESGDFHQCLGEIELIEKACRGL